RRLSFVYVMNFPSVSAPPPLPAPSMAAFRFDSAAGTLTPLAGSPYSTNGATSSPIPHPSGKFLFEVNGSQIQRYSVDPTTGVPTLLSDVTTLTGAGPYLLLPDFSGRYLYVTSNGGPFGGPVT